MDLRKRGLKDVKQRNRRVIVHAVMEQEGLSRVEIARKTELAPSTVSALVAELLEDGILREAGSVVTAGRSRTELTLNPEYGSIAVFEIGRQGTSVTWFNMGLQTLRTDTISHRWVSGNELLSLITGQIHSVNGQLPPLMGLGLLFQEDMRESDFRVMYSTGFSFESITLREALVTQYRLPVEEEYSVTYTITDALSRETDPAVRNSAHISVGSRVLAGVTLDGAEIPLRSDFCEELADALGYTPQESTGGMDLVEYLTSLIAMLCMLFPLELIALSGRALPAGEAEQMLTRKIGSKMKHSPMPVLKFLRPAQHSSGTAVMASQLRRRVLAAH